MYTQVENQQKTAENGEQNVNKVMTFAIFYVALMISSFRQLFRPSPYPFGCKLGDQLSASRVPEGYTICTPCNEKQ